MPDIVLDDGDRILLHGCPFALVTFKTRKPSRAEAARAKRVKKLWAAGFIRSHVVSNTTQQSTLQVSLTDKARAALGYFDLRTVVP